MVSNNVEHLKIARERGFAILYIEISDKSKECEIELSVKKHNSQVLINEFPDSGFDLITLKDFIFDSENKGEFINFGIKCTMFYKDKPTAFYLYPRSSISKTPLIMANGVGIIDSGYRGDVMAFIKYLPYSINESYSLCKDTRLVQICHPKLKPIYIEIVNSGSLSSTIRGEGGFGSTGI